MTAVNSVQREIVLYIISVGNNVVTGYAYQILHVLGHAPYSHAVGGQGAAPLAGDYLAGILQDACGKRGGLGNLRQRAAQPVGVLKIIFTHFKFYLTNIKAKGRIFDGTLLESLFIRVILTLPVRGPPQFAARTSKHTCQIISTYYRIADHNVSLILYRFLCNNLAIYYIISAFTRPLHYRITAKNIAKHCKKTVAIVGGIMTGRLELQSNFGYLESGFLMLIALARLKPLQRRAVMGLPATATPAGAVLVLRFCGLGRVSS
jgi:hypothetical protein